MDGLEVPVAAAVIRRHELRCAEPCWGGAGWCEAVLPERLPHSYLLHGHDSNLGFLSAGLKSESAARWLLSICCSELEKHLNISR